jgi:hypothetical protein
MDDGAEADQPAIAVRHRPPNPGFIADRARLAVLMQLRIRSPSDASKFSATSCQLAPVVERKRIGRVLAHHQAGKREV